VKGRSPDHSPQFGQEWNDYVGYGVSTQTGIWGEPSKADPEAFKQRVAQLVEHQVKYINATFARLDELLGPLPDD